MMPDKYAKTTPPLIRRYRHLDRQALIGVIDQVCAEGRWMQTGRYTANASWEHALTQPNCTCHLLLVVEDGERLGGWCRAYPDDLGRSAEIGIGLLETHREQGLGGAMLRQTVAWAAKSGLAELNLETRLDNQRAIHVFEKIGFQEISAETVRIPPPDGWIRMILPIIPAR